ncbi:MAG TPA: site-specific integrase [Nocardioides sp.]|nr:site-specific integrase [Nocardioides sp.]
MSAPLTPATTSASLARVADLADLAADVVRLVSAGEGAPSTLRARALDVGHFARWCEAHGLDALPAAPSTVALYMAACLRGGGAAGAAVRPSTLRRRLASIAVEHRRAGHDSPCSHDAVRRAWKGIAREVGTAPVKRAPVMRDELRAMLNTVTVEQRGPRDPRTAEARALQAARDRAILALGYAGGFRRSELAGLDVEHLTFRPGGILVFLPRSKTDQAGEGRTVPVDAWPGSDGCPVAALRAWLHLAGITRGPVFRAVDHAARVADSRITDKVVNLTVKRAAERAGLDAASFGGHSLRSGHVSQQLADGAELASVAETTGHRSMAVLRGYDQRRERFSGVRARRLAV